MQILDNKDERRDFNEYEQSLPREEAKIAWHKRKDAERETGKIKN